jgi:hypothetical protein
MPHYTFTLRADAESIEDENGMWFENREQARDYAVNVANELMRGQEQQTRSWRLDIYEDGDLVGEFLFARVDPTLAHLEPRLRAVIEEVSENKRAFRAALSTVQTTLRESRALVARSRGKPFLATVGGKPTVRTDSETPARNRRGRTED